MDQVITNIPQLGAVLQSARKHLGLTQFQAAQRLELTQSRVSKLEQEPGAMTIHQLLSLCSLLGLEISMRQKRSQPSASKNALLPTEESW